jgi:rhodanese-related sulfurtransferase
MSADAPERLAVEPAALAERLERGDVFVIDLRDKVAYMVGHVPGAYLIPRGTLEVRLETLRPDRRRAVAVYCEDGASLSLPAAETLEGLGYRDVRILAGGWRAWKAAGLPRARGDKEEGKAFGEAMARAAGVREIEPGELRDLMGRDVPLYVLDVREPDEYQLGHLPGAINLPRGKLELFIGETVPGKDVTIVTHCLGRTRGLLAARTLAEMGYRNVCALRDGVQAWIRAGFDVETRHPSAVEARAREVAATLPHVEPRAAARLVAEGQATLLDVREPDEYGHAHPEGALSLPRGRLELDAPALLPDRGRAVVVTCDGGPRSVFAADRLRAMGYGDVRVMRGGLPAWRAGGLPIPPSYPEWLVGFPIKIEQVPPDPDAGRGAGGATSGST